MDNCEYLTFLKRQRKKHWGKRAEKPRWRLMGRLLRQTYARKVNPIKNKFLRQQYKMRDIELDKNIELD